MKTFKSILLILLIFINSLCLAACWNYREVDDVAIVAGVGIDKGSTAKYRISVELMNIEGGRESKTTSKIITMEGNSIFDTVRNMIMESGLRLYWSHSKVLIISQDLAREGVLKIVDWYNRDSETRADINIMLSGESTAGEIFDSEGVTETLKSIEMERMAQNQKSVAKSPHVEIWEFVNKLTGEGVEPVTSVVSLKNEKGKNIPMIEGTALFKGDKFIGILNGEESRDMMFVQDEIKGGILTMIEPVNGDECRVALEIFSNKTKVEPVLKKGKLEINIKTETTVAIDEIDGSYNFIDDVGRKKLQSDTEKSLKKHLEHIIEKIQKEYGADIFGFGAKVRQSKPDLWDKIGKDWDKEFKDLKVNVKTKIKIKGSGMMDKTITPGEK